MSWTSYGVAVSRRSGWDASASRAFDEGGDLPADVQCAMASCRAAQQGGDVVSAGAAQGDVKTLPSRCGQRALDMVRIALDAPGSPGIRFRRRRPGHEGHPDRRHQRNAIARPQPGRAPLIVLEREDAHDIVADDGAQQQRLAEFPLQKTGSRLGARECRVCQQRGLFGGDQGRPQPVGFERGVAG